MGVNVGPTLCTEPQWKAEKLEEKLFFFDLFVVV